tara:strand:+ start:671 stop:868 length:198 start_codon:yes stop_codon:yes gene_type:complete
MFSDDEKKNRNKNFKIFYSRAFKHSIVFNLNQHYSTYFQHISAKKQSSNFGFFKMLKNVEKCLKR